MKDKRSTIIIIITVLLLTVFLSPGAEAASGDDYLKVGLKFGSSSVDFVTLESEEGFILGTAGVRSFEEGMPLPAFTKVIVTNENGNIVIKDEEGTLLSSDLGDKGIIMPSNYEDDGVLSVDGKPYRDGIMFLAKTDRTLTVINYIRLEHYVYGVLNSELGHNNPIEALKAQAVAARSFAELNLGKHSADGFDLCTTTHCQVYTGFSGEYPETNEAVDATAGEMIYSEGEPVTAFYFKNSGGYTQNSEDVWSGSLPYLKAIEDEYSPEYPWSSNFSFDAIRQKLEAAGFRPGTVESVSISDRNGTGAVAELTIKGSDATIYLRKENIRKVLGAAVIKSNLFELTDSTEEELAASWKISNGFSTVTPGKMTYLISGSGRILALGEAPVYGSNGLSTVKLGASVTPETVTGDSVNFKGYGYGHGVGMPQDSAVMMAKQGFTYDEILKYYYTNVEVK